MGVASIPERSAPRNAVILIALPPRGDEDLERLWRGFNDSRDRLVADIVRGAANMDLVCACADRFREWRRAFTSECPS
jgi:hypothetical protein